MVVSERDLDFKEFLCLKELEDLKEVRGKIDCLILGDIGELSTDSLTFLTSFCVDNKIKDILYISQPDNTSLNLKTCVVGLGGKYYDDDFFLESEEELGVLLSEKDEINTLVTLPGEGVLRDFKKRFDEGNLKNPSPQYLKVVFNALETVTDEYNHKQNEIELISKETISIFKDISKITEDKTNELDQMHKKLEEVIKQVEGLDDQKPDVRPVGGVAFFPRISVREGSKHIIKIKDVRGTRYLFSFLLGFVKFLDEVRYLKPKLIVLDQVSEFNEVLLKDYNVITKDNFSNTRLYRSEKVIFTSYPTINVVNMLLADNTKDVFVVLDRTVTFKDHLLKGNGVYFASNSSKALDKLGIREDWRICPEGENNFIKLFRIQGYSSDVIMRERQYLDSFKGVYDKLLRRVING